MTSKTTTIALLAPIGIIAIILFLLIASSFGRTPIFPEQEVWYAKRTTINDTTFIVTLHENQRIQPIVTSGNWQHPQRTSYIPFQVLSIGSSQNSADIEVKTGGAHGWEKIRTTTINVGGTYQYCDARIALLNITDTSNPITNIFTPREATATFEINYAGWCPGVPGY